MQDFRRQTGCGIDDATVYLDLQCWDVPAALREYSADQAWTPNLKDCIGTQKSLEQFVAKQTASHRSVSM